MTQKIYQNLGQPRIFVDYFQYILSSGVAKNNGVGNDNIFGHNNDESNNDKLFSLPETSDKLDKLENLFHLDPIDQIEIDFPNSNNNSGPIFRQLTTKTYLSNAEEWNFNYCMVLNHNFHDAQTSLYPEGYESTYASIANKTELINYTSDGKTLYNGFSAILMDPYVVNGLNQDWFNNVQFSLRTQDNATALVPVKIGAISLGTYFDMPHSPDMQLSLEKEFDGIKSIETSGGKRLTNISYTGNPLWTSEPWGLYETLPQNLNSRRMGRRIWNLKFSSIADSDMMPEIEMLNDNGFDDIGDVLPYVGSNTFLSTFIQKTLNGNLKFIFQPDKDDTGPDGFAICTLDQRGVKLTQTSFKTYDVSLRIRETW